MKDTRFDSLARRASTVLSRRTALGLTVGGALGALVRGDAESRKGQGHGNGKKNDKPKPNQFGCLDVGKACRGNDDRCCSGVCQGKKPKPGKKDRSRCVAHNALTCQAGQDTCLGSEIPCGDQGDCFITTGKASFCGDTDLGECFDCKRDRDCEADFGLGAACVVCGGDCPETGDRACISAASPAEESAPRR